MMGKKYYYDHIEGPKDSPFQKNSLGSEWVLRGHDPISNIRIFSTDYGAFQKDNYMKGDTPQTGNYYNIVGTTRQW